jgi:hypothetical protein
MLGQIHRIKDQKSGESQNEVSCILDVQMVEGCLEILPYRRYDI